MQWFKYIDFFISSIINVLFYAYIIKVVFDCEISKNKRKICISIFIASIFIAIVNIFNRDIFKILLTLPFIVMSMKNIYNLNYNKVIWCVIASTLYMFIGEIIIGIILSILPFNYNFIFNNILGTTIGTIIVSALTMPILFIKKLNKTINNLIDYISSKSNNLIVIFIIIAIGAVTYKNLFNSESKINIIMNIAIVLTFIAILYIYCLENTKSQELSKNYNELFKYLEKYEKELVEKRKIIHDYKNQLIIINGYIGDNKKLKEYVDEIINEQRNVSENSIIKNIDKLPRGLKGLIYYKFSHINTKINVNLQILSSLKKFDKLSPKVNKEVLKIIGILIDNAIEAEDCEKEKYIDIQFSINKNVFYMNMKNHCTKDIKFSNLMEIGFSTKGKNRGYGLALVRDILKQEKNIELNLKTDNDEFISKLKVNI